MINWCIHYIWYFCQYCNTSHIFRAYTRYKGCYSGDIRLYSQFVIGQHRQHWESMCVGRYSPYTTQCWCVWVKFAEHWLLTVCLAPVHIVCCEACLTMLGHICSTKICKAWLCGLQTGKNKFYVNWINFVLAYKYNTWLAFTTNFKHYAMQFYRVVMSMTLSVFLNKKLRGGKRVSNGKCVY